MSFLILWLSSKRDRPLNIPHAIFVGLTLGLWHMHQVFIHVTCGLEADPLPRTIHFQTHVTMVSPKQWGNGGASKPVLQTM